MNDWPKSVDLYLHSNKETNWEKGMNIGLSQEALSLFLYAGYEHKMTYQVQENGEAKLISVDGRELR